MKTLTRSTVLLAICALLAFTACDESSPGGTTDVTDDSSRGGRDANNNLTDVSVNNDAGGDTSMGSDSTSSTFDCSVLTVPTDEGDECVDQSSCQGGSCAALSQNDDPTCYRSCVPTAGVCDDACGSGTQCVPLTDQGGNALTFNDGTPRGACVVPPSGDQGPNEYCDTSGDYTCDTSTTAGCAAFEQGATSGQCVVECSQGDTCPAVGSVAGTCAIPQGSSTGQCGNVCDPEDDQCGSAHTCTTFTTSQGSFSICIANAPQ